MNATANFCYAAFAAVMVMHSLGCSIGQYSVLTSSNARVHIYVHVMHKPDVGIYAFSHVFSEFLVK